MRWTVRAVQQLRQDMRPVEQHAADLPWAAEVPWRVRDRVGTERRLRIRRERDQRIVRVDLHGLDAHGGRLACTLLRRQLLAPDHPLRYVRVVVGKGKRSVRGRRVLADLASEILSPEPPLAARSATIDAPDGYLDIWHRDRWPRPRLRSRPR